VKHRDKHWRDILQEIFRFPVLEQRGVLLQFVSDLINDETAAGRQRIICFPQERAFLVDLENAERDARQDIVAASNAAALELERQRSCIPMDHMDTRIGRELPLERTRKCCVKLEQEQMRIWIHSSRNLARVHAFTWPVLGDHAWLAKIHFARDAFHQRF